MKKLNRALRDTIKEEKDNCCEICGHWCGDNNGSPHHIVKISEEPLLRDCKSNILWLYVDGVRKSQGLEIIRFLMGGKLR
jgi:hypothetical protein